MMTDERLAQIEEEDGGTVLVDELIAEIKRLREELSVFRNGKPDDAIILDFVNDTHGVRRGGLWGDPSAYKTVGWWLQRIAKKVRE